MTSYPIPNPKSEEAVTLIIESIEDILEDEEVNPIIVNEGKTQERIVVSGSDAALTFYNDYMNSMTDPLSLASTHIPVTALIDTYNMANLVYSDEFFNKLKMLLDAQAGTFNVEDFNLRNFIYDLIRMRENNPLATPVSLYIYTEGDTDYNGSNLSGNSTRLYIFPRDVPQLDKDTIMQDMNSQPPSYTNPQNSYHIYVYTNNGQGKFSKVESPSSYTIVDQTPTSRSNILVVAAVGGLLIGGVIAAVLMSNSKKTPRVRQ